MQEDLAWILPMPGAEIRTVKNELHRILVPGRGSLRLVKRGSCPGERSATRASPSPDGQTQRESEIKKDLNHPAKAESERL